MSNYITNFSINGLWGRYNLEWSTIREDVNILVGINGAGKTTLVTAIHDYYTSVSKRRKDVYTEARGNEIDVPVSFIQSFDVPADGKKKGNSPLLNNLLGVVMQNPDGASLTNYRLIPVNFPEQADRVSRRVSEFFAVVDDFMSETGKKIEIDKYNNMPFFRTKDNAIVPLQDLSAGEKQMLYILLTVFLMDEKPAVLLMDEPELSLHITWQEKLIKTLRRMNPQCQIILSTHSPSVFLDGWREHLVFVEELLKPLPHADA